MHDHKLVEDDSDTTPGVRLKPIFKNSEMVITASKRIDADIYLNHDYRLELVDEANGAHYRIVQK